MRRKNSKQKQQHPNKPNSPSSKKQQHKHHSTNPTITFSSRSSSNNPSAENSAQPLILPKSNTIQSSEELNNSNDRGKFHSNFKFPKSDSNDSELFLRNKNITKYHIFDGVNNLKPPIIKPSVNFASSSNQSSSTSNRKSRNIYKNSHHTKHNENINKHHFTTFTVTHKSRAHHMKQHELRKQIPILMSLWRYIGG